MLIPLQLLVWKANGALGLEQGGVRQLTERPLGPVVVAGPDGTWVGSWGAHPYLEIGLQGDALRLQPP